MHTGSSFVQRRDAWAEVGGCIESALCCQHTESIYTVFGHFIKEQIVRVSGTPNTYMIVNGQDLPEPLYHPLWGALNLVNDMDDETDSESSFIDLDSRYSSQPPVSVDYQPFQDGLPPHAISIAAKCALLEEDERALAEPPKGRRCAFIDDEAELDPRNYDSEQPALQMSWPSLQVTADLIVRQPEPDIEPPENQRLGIMMMRYRMLCKPNSRCLFALLSIFDPRQHSASTIRKGSAVSKITRPLLCHFAFHSSLG